MNGAVLSYGEALLADPNRFGDVAYLGLDETLFSRTAPYYRPEFSTSIVDVGNGQLLDVVPGRSSKEPTGPYRKVFADTVPHATLVADPFHRIRRLLTKAAERLDEKGTEKITGLLAAGDPHGEVTASYTAKEAVCEFYSFVDETLAGTWIDELIRDINDPTWPIEVRSLGRRLKTWRKGIISWH